jgi:hypothetical protein
MITSPLFQEGPTRMPVKAIPGIDVAQMDSMAGPEDGVGPWRSVRYERSNEARADLRRHAAYCVALLIISALCEGIGQRAVACLNDTDGKRAPVWPFALAVLVPSYMIASEG